MHSVILQAIICKEIKCSYGHIFSNSKQHWKVCCNVTTNNSKRKLSSKRAHLNKYKTEGTHGQSLLL